MRCVANAQRTTELPEDGEALLPTPMFCHHHHHWEARTALMPYCRTPAPAVMRPVVANAAAGDGAGAAQQNVLHPGDCSAHALHAAQLCLYATAAGAA